ncbi:DUF5376 domain-containing protein [Pseudoleptotrichia goodfellowii]|jgi:hypothetical protein|uniref:Uncharacterized protein n=1 Tax=Pseudoleptotrichia goodfellowii F0264 TaxID=596323 RepID=D0GKE6_9FUSO|nr:DUF5376 domain-containing protein [Pseudoleptotrichia goodfellowii]EEY35427.1 hypothetical protein HMPREF0554_2253 [Pseudoleptotrichia goodfellowii F0264]
MKLIFKYVCHEGWVPKSYIRVCKSFRRVNEISGEINQKDFWDLVLKKNILNEIYLAEYLYDTDLNLAEYVLDKLNDKTIDDYDIGSQGWDVELEEDKVVIGQMCSSEDDKRAYINREEVAYAMLKWKHFLEREFDVPDYQEVIDTEDVYRGEK